MILIGLHYTLVLCHSFKGCALPPSLLFHALFLSPIQTHKVASTIFWRDNQKIAGLGREILYNIQPLILPNTGHTGDLRDAQTPVQGVPGGHHALTCLGRDLVLKRLSRLNLLGDPLVPGVPGGRHASTCLGIRSLGGCHASACLGICTLTRGCLALRLQQFWVG